jgi:hypothetical protein
MKTLIIQNDKQEEIRLDRDRFFQLGFELCYLNNDPNHFILEFKVVSHQVNLELLLSNCFEQYAASYVQNKGQMGQNYYLNFTENKSTPLSVRIEIDLIETNSSILYLEAYLYDAEHLLIGKGGQQFI